MALMVSAVLAAAAQGITWTSSLSGIFGSVSLTAWICLLLPQLVANYKSKSADGLSMAFLVVWLLGDATNLVGALLTKLAPTAIALAGYFCVADVVLISQCFYYNSINSDKAHQAQHGEAGEPNEDSPLLRRTSSAGLPGSQRRHSTHTETAADPLLKIVAGEDETPDSNPWLHNALSLFAVYLIGFAGWFVSYEVGAWDGGKPSQPHSPTGDTKSTAEIVGLALGYISAVLYLLARIPQIIKNWREKSCEGLAILFFMLSLTGNLTYGLSLIFYSQDKKYLFNTLPWLIGSLGTIVEDSIIFVQFRMYSGSAGIRSSAIE